MVKIINIIYAIIFLLYYLLSNFIYRLSPPSHTIDSNNAIKSNYPSHNDLINDGVIVAHMSMNEWVEYTNLTNETKSQAELVALASNRSSKKSDCESISLSFYGLSASQSNSESYLRIGDFYYYGKAGLLEDKLKASRFYQLAADLRNTHAIFNLGIDILYLFSIYKCTNINIIIM